MPDASECEQPATAGRPAKQRGLECPRYGCGHFRVIYKRRACGARILLRRECRHCGRLMTTYETSAV